MQHESGGGCEHRFAFQRTAKFSESGAGYNVRYVRIDTYFCERCLHQEHVRREEWAHEMPDWYRD